MKKHIFVQIGFPNSNRPDKKLKNTKIQMTILFLQTKFFSTNAEKSYSKIKESTPYNMKVLNSRG